MIVRARRSHSGFTLLEILVVLIVVGLLASLAVVNMGGGTQQREMENQIRELYLLMQTASEQAILNNQELGLILEEDGYRFVLLDETTDEWEQQDERLFRPRTLSKWLVVTDYIDNDTRRLGSEEDRLVPDVMFFSSGETTDFEIEFTIGRDSSYMHKIYGGGFAPMTWEKPGDDEGEL